MPIDMTAVKDVLYSAVLSDLLDEFGHRDQAMRPFVRPLDENVPLFGRARTGIYMNWRPPLSGRAPAPRSLRPARWLRRAHSLSTWSCPSD
jgi:4-hydroxy-4-methyl-2-oxoglutarate aldolase